MIPFTSLFLLALAAGTAEDAPALDLGAAKELKVLYAGAPGDVRERRFVEFLRGAFAKVGTVDLAALDAAAAAPYDVVVTDWKRLYEGGEFKGELPGMHLPADWSKATLVIGATVRAAEGNSKLDWL